MLLFEMDYLLRAVGAAALSKRACLMTLGKTLPIIRITRSTANILQPKEGG
jgi:hypothetical protein